MKYLIVLEKKETGYSVYSPDLPGCVSTGETKAQAQENMRDAIEFHIAGMQAEGYEIPQPSSFSSYVEIAA